MEIPKKITIKDVEKAINDVYIIKDIGIARVLYATIVSNRIDINAAPVWLLILGGSSSGKTAIIQTLDNIGKWIVPVDTLTTNTFASGLNREEEVSLLWKANKGILVFKDFTTITTMNQDALREIMGQMRAIYDGSFNKKTGNAVEVNWKDGKIGVVAGGTIQVQRRMREFAKQGERFINYILTPPDSKEMTLRALKNQSDLKSKEKHLAEIVGKFINQVLLDANDKEYYFSEDFENRLVDVSDFCTLARSPVEVDIKTGRIIFVDDREMPTRAAMMLKSLGKGLMMVCDESTLSKQNEDILFKTAFDSIPVTRRMVLRLLGGHKNATTKNLAIKLNLPTDTIRSWCNELNGLKLITREAAGQSDIWTLKPEYKEIVVKYEKLMVFDKTLEPNHDDILNAGDIKINEDEDESNMEELLNNLITSDDDHKEEYDLFNYD